MTATPDTRPRIWPKSSRRRQSGIVLLVGAVVVSATVEPIGGAQLYWMPLVLGLTYVLAGLTSGGTSRLAAAGLVVTGWAVAVLLVRSGTLDADFAATGILGLGVGALLACQIPRVGFTVTPYSLAVPVVLVGLLALLQSEAGGVFNKGWLYGGLLAARGLWDLVGGQQPGDGRGAR